MKTVQGEISYKKKEVPKTLDPRQVFRAEKVAREVVKTGLNALIDYSSGTIDIIVVMGNGTQNSLNRGIFRIFWSSSGEYKIGYLGVGIGHFDGYEIHRDWIDNLQVSDVVETLEKNIEYYNKTFAQQNKTFK